MSGFAIGFSAAFLIVFAGVSESEIEFESDSASAAGFDSAPGFLAEFGLGSVPESEPAPVIAYR